MPRWPDQLHRALQADRALSVGYPPAGAPPGAARADQGLRVHAEAPRRQDGAPDDAPQRLAHLAAIEACHSVAGEENYILKVRVASPTDLEDLLQQIRASAGVSTRTTIVLSTPYENRPPNL